MKSRLFAGLACVLPAIPALFVTAGQASAATTTSEVISSASTCSYVNQPDAVPGWNWTSPTFDDSWWRKGRQPLGHREAVATDVGSPQTVAYFRCSFTLPLDQKVQAAEVSLRVDDGALVRLNGAEIARFNVPTGTLTSRTNATSIDPYDGQRWQTVRADPALLKPGKNILALQVHAAGNETWTSGDLTMEARARVTLEASSTPTPMPTPKPVTTSNAATTTTAPTTTNAPTTAPTTAPAAPAGWRLLWSDEFNGGSLDRTRWRAYANTYGDADPYMLHCMTPDNVKVTNGTLKLIAQRRPIVCANGKYRNYASGFVGSREAGRLYPLFGRFEIRARTPHGQGLFPGVWLRHARGAGTAEVDIFEQFHASAPGQATQTLHFPNTIGYNVAKKGTVYEQAVQGRGEWHTFSVDITPVIPGDRSQGRFRFAIDGRTTFEYVNTRMSTWSGSDQTWDIALQLYVGGAWAGHPDQRLGYYPAKGGICAQTSRAPLYGNPANCPTRGIWLAPWQDSTFEIDYVRVFTPA